MGNLLKTLESLLCQIRIRTYDYHWLGIAEKMLFVKKYKNCGICKICSALR